MRPLWIKLRKGFGLHLGVTQYQLTSSSKIDGAVDDHIIIQRKQALGPTGDKEFAEE